MELYTICLCDWLISLSMVFSRFSHVVAHVRISLFFKVEEYSIVWICHILFIHPLVNGHLGYFHHLAIVNNAIMNIGVQIFLWDPVFNSFWYVPRSGIHMLILFFIFWGVTILFSTLCTSFTFPSIVHKGFNFCTSSAKLVIFCFSKLILINSHPSGCEVVPHCSFDLHFPND